LARTYSLDLIAPGLVALLCVFLLPQSHAGDPPQTPLAGRWASGRISTIQYRDAYTGVSKPPSGNHFSYEFRPDGTYSFTGLIQSTMYHCTTSMFAQETGRYHVSGSAVSLEPEKNPYKLMNNCAPSSSKEGSGKLVTKKFQFRVEGSTLVLTGDDGSSSQFRREPQ
jgi:hypothetical protein